MDYYTVLGVAKTATADEIKRSYRTLALKYHPDRNKSADAESKFRECVAAYEVLSDPSKRSLYDLQGYVGRRPTTPPKPPTPPPSPAPPPSAPKPPPPKKEPKRPRKPEKTPMGDRDPTWDPDWNLKPKMPHQHELDAIHCMYFGPENAGRSILVHLRCSPDELRSGCKKQVKIKRRKSCARCAGDQVIFERCTRCNGNWQSTKMQVWGAPDKCPVCQGGPGQSKQCSQCDGTGLFPWEIKEVAVMVPPGTKAGTRLVYAEGEDGCKGQVPGKLHVLLV